MSVCILTLNEEERLRACVQSIGPALEVLVLDAGSTDSTVELARGLGCRVEHRNFVDFSEQRNAAAQMAENEWILFLDADERLSLELRECLVELFSESHPVDGLYQLRRRNHYLGQTLRFGAWEPDRVLRLYRRDLARWEGALHETLKPGNPKLPVIRLKGRLEHQSFRNLKDQIQRLQHYAWLAGQLKAPGSFWRLLAHPPWRFFRAYVLKFGFLEGRRGLLQAILAGYSSFLKHAYRWERSFLSVEGVGPEEDTGSVTLQNPGKKPPEHSQENE